VRQRHSIAAPSATPDLHYGWRPPGYLRRYPATFAASAKPDMWTSLASDVFHRSTWRA